MDIAHYDDDYFDPETGNTSEWTLLIYLSGKETGVIGLRSPSSLPSLPLFFFFLLLILHARVLVENRW